MLTRTDMLTIATAALVCDAGVDSIRATLKPNKKALSAGLFAMLRDGATVEDFDSFRDAAYAAAEAEGVKVNKKSNSVAVLVSKAKTVADSPLRAEIVSESESLNAAYNAAREAAKAAESANEEAGKEPASVEELHEIIATAIAELAERGEYWKLVAIKTKGEPSH